MSAALNENAVEESKLDPKYIDEVKPILKRRRRGKKRKFKTENTCVENCVSDDNINTSTTIGEETYICEAGPNCLARRHPNRILIRPLHVPKAPENTNQFIMDDHGESRLYYSFETPNPKMNPFHCKTITTEDKTDNLRTVDAAFQDVDYKYVSWLAEDTSFYDKDFERSYYNQRFDELWRLTRPELVIKFKARDILTQNLEDDLVKFDPYPALEQLQQQLLELQEENVMLKECNLDLKKLLKGDTDESCSEHSQDEGMSGNESEIKV